jgi:hypothetical protein
VEAFQLRSVTLDDVPLAARPVGTVAPCTHQLAWYVTPFSLTSKPAV